jgi:hypothetical protein
LPIELIAAMPGATTDPARKAVGRVQKIGSGGVDAEGVDRQRDHLQDGIAEKGGAADADRR